MVEEKEISREEIREVVRKMKDGKAVGIDEVPGEIWKYGGEEMEEWIGGFATRYGKGEVGRKDGRRVR